MSERKWQGKWIWAPGCPGDAAPLFRKKITLGQVQADARVFVSGVGFYSLYINGKRVSDEWLAPAFSAYDHRVYYNVYSAAEYLNPGENTIEMILGNGWFNEQQKNAWGFEQARWKHAPQLIFELEMGGKVILSSDSSWEWSPSQIVFNSLRCGETCDRTRKTGPFCGAAIAHGPGGVLLRQEIPPIRLREKRKPVKQWAVSGGVLYDFGVNLSGNVEICVSGCRGKKISIQYSERIFEDGFPDLASNAQYVEGGRFQKDEYVLAGETEERWHSELGYNGFRYAIISGNCRVHEVIARGFHTDLKDAGEIICDYAPVTEIHQAVRRSTLTNFHHVPTDCPHREKNGWTGDAHLSCEQALYNFDMKAAYLKYLDDLTDSQRPNGAVACIVPPGVFDYNWGTGATWDYALFEIPWQLYCFTGDQTVLRRYFAPMGRYLAYLETMGEKDIFRDGLGDWCPPREAAPCPDALLVTAYAAACFERYAQAARVLGEEAEYAQARAAEIKEALLREFVGKTEEGQTYLALLLFFRLTDDPAKTAEKLVRRIEADGGHMYCGIFGTRMILDVLTENGHFDTAWKIAMAEGYPGYRDMLSRGGGTLGEHWDGSYSWNHHMFSPVGAWFYKALGGLEMEQAGFERVRIHPHMPEEIGSFSCSHDTPRGKISISWDREQVHISLPAGCIGRVHLKHDIQEMQNTAVFSRHDFE